jgi:hypothetical protein
MSFYSQNASLSNRGAGHQQKGDRIEREIVPQDADSSPKRPVPGPYLVQQPSASQFDYCGIAPSLVPDLRAQAKLIKNLIAKTTEGLIEVGRNLVAVKQHLNHGQFIDWVEIEVGIDKRTAQSYMAIARLAEAKGATVALLPPTTAHRLAAISAPVEVVDHILDRAVKGEWLGGSDCLFLRRNSAEPMVPLPWRVWAALLARMPR